MGLSHNENIELMLGYPNYETPLLRAWKRQVLLPFLLLMVGSLYLLPGMRAFGQAQNSGTVTGRVTDPTGSAISSATVTLISEQQHRTVTVKSNSQGEYTFNAVPIASYTVTISAATFATYSVTQVGVSAGENITINAVLQPAGVSATVTVNAETQPLATQSATIGVTVDNALVENLPLDGNNVVQVAALLPGVTNVVSPTTFTSDTSGPTYNASGARSNQNLLLLDGALWNNLSQNTGLNFPPRQGIQEVSVLVNNYKAQYGRNVGSVFNVLSRSGTEAFHGQIWEFMQNSAVNATDYLSHANPHLVQNQFGAALGGPIRHNKLFFFLTFQDLRLASVVTAQASTPTPDERGLAADGTTPRPCVTPAFAGHNCASFTGDSLPLDSHGNPVLPNPVRRNPANDPASQSAIQTAWTNAGHTGTSPCLTLLLAQPSSPSTASGSATGIPNGEIPDVCFNPISVRLLDRLPLPTTILSGTTLPYAVSQTLQPRNDYDGMARVDWNLGRHTIAARYYKTSVDDLTANGVNAGVGVASYEVNYNSGGIDYGNIDDTWVISGNLLNTIRVAYKRYVYDVAPTDTSSLSSLGAKYTDPNRPALPAISVTTRFNVGTATSNYIHSVNENVQVDDSLNWTIGKHNIQIGGEYLRLQYLRQYDQQPSFIFNNAYSFVPMADFLLGLPQAETVGNAVNQAAIQHDLYLYAQDDWRVTPKLTLNYGLRYELPFQWYEPDGEAATFIPGYRSLQFPQAPLNVAYPGDRGIERSLVGTSKNNVAPRIGFSYDVFGNGRLAIRGGFGIFYDAINAQVVGVSQPFHYQANIVYPTGGLSEPLQGQNAIPANYVKGQPAQFVYPFSITYPDPNFRTPYSESFNLGIQQEIKHSSTIEIDYVGRAGRHLAAGYDQNPAIWDCSGPYFQANPSVYCTNASGSAASYAARVRYPNFNYGGSGVLDYMTEAASSYNALQVIYTARFRKKLNLLASYVYSKSMDDSSNISIVNTADQPSLTARHAVSDFNATQVFNLGFNLQLPRVNHHLYAPARAVINGWSFSGVYNARTGRPFSVQNATDASLRDEYPQFVSFVAGGYKPLPSNRHRVDKVEQWFNVAGVCNPPQIYGANTGGNPTPSSCPYLPGNYGTAPRNFFVGPAFIYTGFALQRSLAFDKKSSTRLDLRIDVFNAFNTPNLGNPQTILTGSSTQNQNFGHILATAGTNGAVATNGRRMQLSGTFRF